MKIVASVVIVALVVLSRGILLIISVAGAAAIATDYLFQKGTGLAYDFVTK